MSNDKDIIFLQDLFKVFTDMFQQILAFIKELFGEETAPEGGEAES